VFEVAAQTSVEIACVVIVTGTEVSDKNSYSDRNWIVRGKNADSAPIAETIV